MDSIDRCQQMLFYGSEKYPVEDEYMKFVTERGE